MQRKGGVVRYPQISVFLCPLYVRLRRVGILGSSRRVSVPKVESIDSYRGRSRDLTEVRRRLFVRPSEGRKCGRSPTPEPERGHGLGNFPEVDDTEPSRSGASAAGRRRGMSIRSESVTAPYAPAWRLLGVAACGPRLALLETPCLRFCCRRYARPGRGCPCPTAIHASGGAEPSGGREAMRFGSTRRWRSTGPSCSATWLPSTGSRQ